MGERQSVGVEGLLPRKIYRYDVELEEVLDLTDPACRSEVGVRLDVLTGPDWKECQELGVAAHALGVQGIQAPGATGVGAVLAVFVQRIGLGVIEPSLVEEWQNVADL
jgi:RES domain-containing protein